MSSALYDYRHRTVWQTDPFQLDWDSTTVSILSLEAGRLVRYNLVVIGG